MGKNSITALLATAIALLGVGIQAVRAAEAPATPVTVQVHGYMQNRLYFGDGASPEFRSERISVSTLATLPNESNAFVEVYYHPWAAASGLYLESAYYDTNLDLGRLRVGRGRRITFGITPAYPNRRTSNYGIVSEAFTQDRVQGVQYYLKRDILDLGVGVFTGMRLGSRPAGEIPGDATHNATHSVPHLSFRDLPGALSTKLEATARLGVNLPIGLKAGVSGLFGTVDPLDLVNLTTSSAANSLTPGATPSLLPAGTTDKDRNVWALDATYKHKSGFLAQGEYYDATVSNLGYNAWNGLVGYEHPSGWRGYARYAEQNMDTARTANPLTWDLRQLSLAVAQPISKGVWLQYEYEGNFESTASGAKVKNNIFFVELFSGF